MLKDQLLKQIWNSTKSGIYFKASSHGSPIGLDEIKLVRKVLDWKHKPFEIPKSILNEWRKIGNKGAKLDSAWSKIYKRKKNLVDKVFKNNFSKALKSEKQNSLREIIFKYFIY